MRKILALALPLLFLSLISIQANAAMTPVEVERVKDICSVRIRGDHATQSLLFHYVNLSPWLQFICVEGWFFYDPTEEPCGWTGSHYYEVIPGDSKADAYYIGTYDYYIYVKVFVDHYLVLGYWLIIPPPP